MSTLKPLNQILAFLNLYQHAKKISLFHLFFFEIPSILESHDQTSHTYFWPCPPKELLTSFWFLGIFISMQKKFPSARSSDRVNWRVPSADWPHLFLTMSTPPPPPPKKKNFWSAFNFCESVLTCKKKFILSVHSSDTVNFRVLSAD